MDDHDALRVGIDMDDVLVDFTSGWMQRYNAEFGTTLEPKDIVAWSGIVTTTHFETMEAFWDWSRGDGVSVFRDAPAMPGAVEALARIAERHRIHIVSSKPDWAIPDALAWLGDHGITAREVHFLWDKTTAPCDVFLDDAPHQLEALIEKRPEATICRRVQAWNRPIEGVVDIEDWPTFERLLDRIAAARGEVPREVAAR